MGAGDGTFSSIAAGHGDRKVTMVTGASDCQPAQRPAEGTALCPSGDRCALPQEAGSGEGQSSGP